MHLLAFAMLFRFDFNPFIVPVAGCFMILGIVVAGIWSGVRTREIQSKERLAAIAAGLPIPPTLEELALSQKATTSMGRRQRGNVRRGGVVLVGVAAGLILFFVALAIVLQTRAILSGAAAGLIPLGIGVGLLIDARMQTRELAQTGGPEPREASTDSRPPYLPG